LSNTSELLKKLISFVSLTPDDGGAFDFIPSLLPDWQSIRIDKNGVKNLLITKKFGDGIHFSFAGHIDVVPAGTGWISNPFEATTRDGYIYGRGSADMKGGMAAFLSTCIDIKNFNGTISLILTSDEEGDGIYGTDEVMKYMRDNNCLPDICIVAEPTCTTNFGDTIKVGRRGSINGVIRIIGKGGHAAYPQNAISPINILSKVLPNLSDKELDNGDEFFEPSRLVITDIKAGVGKHNVIPSDVTILFNVRNSTKTSKDDIEKYIRETLNQYNFELDINQSSYPFITDSKNSKIINLLSEAIFDTYNIKPILSTGGGTSDARFIATYGVDVVEFGVMNDTIHAPNERVSIEELEKTKIVFEKVVNLL
jgi:succinyl-diaminopimelate desuccinylase